MSKSAKPSLLITVSGNDGPGITSGLTEVLAKNAAQIIDIAQAVVQHLLSLSILVELPKNGEDQLKQALTKKAEELGLKAEFRKISANDTEYSSRRSYHYAVTLIAECVTAHSLHAVTAVLAESKLNIEVIKRLSDGEFGCVEIMVSSASPINELTLRKTLLEIAKDQAVDIALQAEGLYRRAKRLVVLDMDSTLIQAEVIDELARAHGVYDEVAEITHQAMNGKMNYDESLKRRCEKLKGLKQEALEKVLSGIELTPGAEDLIRVLKKLGYKIAVLSGGFSFVADRLKERLGIDFAYSNLLEMEKGVVTGRVVPPIVNAQRKADLLDVIAQQEKVGLDQVIAIGDGANDLLMLEKAGLGIAFNAKPMVREKADLSLSQKNLRSALYLLGLSARDVEEAIST